MTLLMRDQENIEKGMEIGMEIGIAGMISSLRDFDIPEHTILQKIQEKYGLTSTEAERYMNTSP